MAASVKSEVMAAATEEPSSSEDDEALRRCQEAVWESAPVKKTEEDGFVKESKRVVVAEHEHDGNELQVSRGFRTHVAKKLGHLLDSYISETQLETSSCVKSTEDDDDNDDKGFRLFSTSVPGHIVEESPAPLRRRPAPSSSDSDSEMEARLREAAVSVKDLLPSFAMPSTQLPSSVKTKKDENVKDKLQSDEERCHVVKKKKKKKRQTEEESSRVDYISSLNTIKNGDSENSEPIKVKKKKKKKKPGENTMEGALN